MLAYFYILGLFYLFMLYLYNSKNITCLIFILARKGQLKIFHVLGYMALLAAYHQIGIAHTVLEIRIRNWLAVF